MGLLSKLWEIVKDRGFFHAAVHGGGGLVAKSCLTLATPWTVACQAPLSMGFSRQEYWSRLPFPSPGDLPQPGIKLRSPALQAISLPQSHQGSPLLKVGSCQIRSYGKMFFKSTIQCIIFL